MQRTHQSLQSLKTRDIEIVMSQGYRRKLRRRPGHDDSSFCCRFGSELSFEVTLHRTAVLNSVYSTGQNFTHPNTLHSCNV